jgi:ribosome maturation protein SDO1
MSSQIVKYQKGKSKFEIITQHGSVRKYSDKLESLTKHDLNNILSSDVIYTNSKKGNQAKKEDLELVFGSSDLLVCVKAMLGQGSSQTSGKERKQDSNQKKSEILTYLNKNYIDAKTGYPHPITRLETSIKNIKYNIDSTKGVDVQVRDIIKKLHGVLFFKENSHTYELVISNEYKGCTNTIYGLTSVTSKKKEREKTKYVISVVPGNEDTFMKKLNELTQGDYQLKLLK